MLVGIVMAGGALIGLASVTTMAAFYLFLLLQRARVRVWRAAAEPGAALAMVRQGARPRDGHRVSRHRHWRRDRAAPRLHADAGVRVARRAAHSRVPDDCRGAAGCVVREATGPARGSACHAEARGTGTRGRRRVTTQDDSVAGAVLLPRHRQHGVDWRRGRHDPEPGALSAASIASCRRWKSTARSRSC